jgi:hypothetical protein
MHSMNTRSAFSAQCRAHSLGSVGPPPSPVTTSIVPTSTSAGLAALRTSFSFLVSRALAALTHTHPAAANNKRNRLTFMTALRYKKE